MPGKIKNLGDIDLYFYLNDEFQGKERLYYSGGTDLIINDKKYTLDYLDGFDYPTFWEIFINGDYEKEPLCVVEKGDVVLDIGANKGFFTLNALQKGASKVYSVEPIKNSYEQIKKLLTDFSNVEPINKAIGETNGVITMLCFFVGKSLIHDSSLGRACMIDDHTSSPSLLNSSIAHAYGSFI
jgi:hypothetical protein